MARKALGPNALAMVSAVRAVLVSDVPRTRTVRVACSGGPDSLALAAACAWVQQHRPDVLRQITAMVIDHGLQDRSAEVAAAAAAQVSDLGVPTTVVRVNVDTETGDGLEAAARDARYSALRADAPDMVLLGHTLDDQAETVLLGLARGSGTRSLGGMPERFGTKPQFVRPLLQLRRTTTTAACDEFGLTPWHDPHNSSTKFLRARVRAELMPRLTEVLGPGVAEALARTADLTRADADYLDQTAAAALLTVQQPDGHLDAKALTAVPEPIQSRIVRQWLASFDLTDVSYERTQAILALITDWRGQGPCQLAGAEVVRVGTTIQLLRR